MAIVYSKQTFIERIKRHIADGWPTSSFSASDNEVLLYIDQAIAYNIIGQVYANSKIEGALVIPEGYLVTHLLTTLQQDSVTRNWYSTLPQPPLNLPLGYSINRVYAANSVDGQGIDFWPVKAKRVSYRNLLPSPQGARYWVEANKIWMAINDGSSLLGQNVYVQMPSSRTEDVTEVMAMPDDAIEAVFKNVTDKLIQRMQLPKDIVQDDLSAGNKSS
jgi:hypothetical protein